MSSIWTPGAGTAAKAERLIAAGLYARHSARRIWLPGDSCPAPFLPNPLPSRRDLPPCPGRPAFERIFPKQEALGTARIFPGLARARRQTTKAAAAGSSLSDAVMAFTWEEASDGDALVDRTGRGNDMTDHGTCTRGTASGKVTKWGQTQVAFSQYWSLADNADASTGDVDFFISIWSLIVAGPGIGGNYGIWNKWGGSDLEYTLWYSGGYAPQRKIQFKVRDTGDTTTTTVAATVADSYNSGTTDTWWHVIAYHDSTANEIGIIINNTTTYTASTSGGVRNGTQELNIGRYNNSQYTNQKYDCGGMWKGRLPTTTEKATLAGANQWPYT